ncbi:putative integrase, catalytic region [Brucella grignonensis]|uniref:Putative integrase, catalytic region n=1 Tax=Brucella grignonensis TaxID=94627 RepID=A0A256EZ39_9HYPH|nr:putative integrase, catalytic region [Brucella grignonensis]
MLVTDELERLCAIVAAMKICTINRKWGHLSTKRTLELLEKHGVETPDGFVKPAYNIDSKPPSSSFGL